MASSGYYAAVAALSPDTFHKLNDTAGTTAVDTMAAQNGTYTEADAEGYTLNQTSIIPGEPDEPSVLFNSDNDSGSGGRVYVPDGSHYAYSPNANEFTCLFTYQPIAGFAAAQRDLVGKLNEWQLWVETTGKTTLYVTPAWSSKAMATTLVAGTPYHICIRQGGGTMEMFINGASDGSLSKTSNLTDSALEFRGAGGSSPGTGRFSVGYFQGIAIWNGSYLSNTNISDLQALWAQIPGSGLGKATRDPKSGLYTYRQPYFTRRWRG